MMLKGRVALVTGAARRVGRAIAETLAREGCHVAVHYNRSAEAAMETAEACRAAGVEAETFSADFADPQAPAALVMQLQRRFERLDVLVNNASVFEPMTLDAFDLADWQRTLQVNLTAPLQLTLAARDLLRAAEGCVVNLADISTERPWTSHLAYSISKGGLDTLSRLLARALAPEVRVNAVAPGVAAWPDDYSQEFREKLTRRIPLKRAGTPEDVAAAVRYLLRDGDYLTGVTLPVDGGRRIV